MSSISNMARILPSISKVSVQPSARSSCVTIPRATEP
jgi:hypothetical protein